MRALCIVSALFVGVSYATEVAKLAIWHSAGTTSENYMISRSVTVDDAAAMVSPSLNADSVIVLESFASKSVFEMPYLASMIQESSTSTIIPNIYSSEENKNLKNALLNLDNLKNAKATPLSKVVEQLKSGKHQQAYLVELSDDIKSSNLLHELHSLDKKISFIAFEDSRNLASLPQRHGNYIRLLEEASIDAISNSTDPAYKPEGAEYSIYYYGQYLYITPDIFTGIITGIFIAFTLLIGLSCLGAIQTPSTFSSKIPPVGREA